MFAGFVILGWMSPQELGVWQSLLIVQSYATIVQGGITSGLNRELPFRVGAGDSSVWSLAATGQTFAVASSSFLVAAGIISCFVGGTPLVRYSLAIILFVTAANTYENYLAVTFRADQAFDKLARVYLGLAVLNVVTLPIVYFFGYKGLVQRYLFIALVSVTATHWCRPFRLPLRLKIRDLVELAKVGVPLFFFGYIIGVAATFPKTILLMQSGTTMVGLFAPAAAMLGVMALLPGSVSQYIYAKMSFRFGQQGDPRALWSYAWKASVGSLALSLPIAIAASVVFPWFVRTFYPKYTEAAPAVVWVSIAGALFSSSMFSSALNSMQAWRWITISSLSRVALSFILPYAFVRMYSGSLLVGVSVGYACAGAVSFMIGLGCTYWATHPSVASVKEG
jgi:O-antigen/teichoic acid export membrane protein